MRAAPRSRRIRLSSILCFNPFLFSPHQSKEGSTIQFARLAEWGYSECVDDGVVNFQFARAMLVRFANEGIKKYIRSRSSCQLRVRDPYWRACQTWHLGRAIFDGRPRARGSNGVNARRPIAVDLPQGDNR
jgi:hypothetical protein